ncbi:MAG: hypothetical protein LBS53_04180 [Synergistaceae bacterium]|jgi:hypothetical protein|nr:hypothetical protein [Synergistaceae bacterium]
MMKHFVFLCLCCVSLLVVSAAVVPAEAAMPKKGDVAVIAVPMNGQSAEYTDIVENAVIQELVSSGYKVVDEAKKRQIHKAAAQKKADAAYLNGDVEALMKISFSYGVGTTVTVKFRVDNPAENEFKMYTGTASATFNARDSKGNYSYASRKTIMAKQVGYSEDEARTKSIDYAASAVAGELVK